MLAEIKTNIYLMSMEVYNHRQIPLMDDTSRTNSLLKQMSSESSDSSVSSVLLSMCPLAITDNQCPTRTSVRKKKIYSKKNDSLQVSSDRDSLPSHSPNTERKFDNDTQSVSESELSFTRNKQKRKLSNLRLMDFLNRERECESSTVSLQTCIQKLLLHPKLTNEDEPKQCSSMPCVSTVPAHISISPERILQLKQRHIELDRTVEKLLEAITYETNKIIQQISKYWSYIKQNSLDKYQPKGYPYQLFDYLIKSSFYNREYELFFEQNDEIAAAVQVLSTTLSIVSEKHSFTVINRAFDEEEKQMRDHLQYQSELLLASYTDELSLMRETIRFFQANSTGEKDFQWIQIIQIDYPYLIEKISNDFLIQMPRIEHILLELLRNTKKHLLSIHTGGNQN